MLLEQERQLVAEYGKRLIIHGLTRGTGGNLSIFNRESGFAAVSPSGLDYFETRPEDVPVVDLAGALADGATSERTLVAEVHRPVPEVLALRLDPLNFLAGQ